MSRLSRDTARQHILGLSQQNNASAIYSYQPNSN